MKRSVRFPRACKRVTTPPPCTNTVSKRNPRHIRKNREAAMASVLKDGSNNARILKKLTLESTSAVSEALSTVLISTGADRCNVVTTDHTAVATASDLSPPTISTTETLSTVLTSAQLTPTVAATAVEVSTVNTAVTTSINISPPTINTSSSTSSHFDCYNKRFSVYRGGIDTTMVHDEPLVAELTCRSTMPHRKGINGIRHLSNHLPRIRDFGTQTDIKITDDDIMFLKNLKAKRMEISHINAIVKNNEYIVSYHEPEESYRWDYLRMLNGEGPYNGLAEWERNQMHLEAIATVMNMQNINANINVPNGADIKKHPPGNISPISDDSQ